LVKALVIAARSSIFSAMAPRQHGFAINSQALTQDQTRSVFGQVMGLVALTAGCTALGAYIGRNLSGGAGIIFFLGAFACIFGLQFAAARGREQLAIGLLFGLGLLLGLAVGPLLADYAKTDPGALYQAAGATALFIGILGAGGYAIRRDLSSWARTLFWALVALLVFGLIATFVAIPHANMIYTVLGLVIFGFFTIFDFNRLRRTNMAGAVPIAASIFLDIFNVFLFFLRIFGGGGRS
jgi:FtsH-binding integral membrane protein